MPGLDSFLPSASSASSELLPPDLQHLEEPSEGAGLGVVGEHIVADYAGVRDLGGGLPDEVSAAVHVGLEQVEVRLEELLSSYQERRIGGVGEVVLLRESVGEGRLEGWWKVQRKEGQVERVKSGVSAPHLPLCGGAGALAGGVEEGDEEAVEDGGRGGGGGDGRIGGEGGDRYAQLGEAH